MMKAPDDSNIAQMAPKRVWRKCFFYMRNCGFIVRSLAGSGALSLLLYQFLYIDIIQSTNINMEFWEMVLTISVCAFIAIFFFNALRVIVTTLIHIEIEHAYARRMYAKVDEVTDESTTKRYEGDLETLKNYLIKNAHYDSAMERMFTYIHSEARNRHFHSVALTTQLYREECETFIDKTADYQRSVLQLGILGTFIGLVISFSKFNNITIDDNVFREIIGTLKYAFSTSILGLVAAIFLGAIFSYLQKKKEKYFVMMEKAAAAFGSIVYDAKNTATDYKTFRNISDAININTEELLNQQKQIKGLTSAINVGMQALKLKSEEFDGFLQNLSQAELSYLEKMQKIYDVLSPQTISEELNAKLKEATFGYFEATNAKYSELNSTVSETGELFKKLGSKIAIMSYDLGKTVEEQQKFIEELTKNNAIEELTRAVEASSQKLGKELNSNIKTINSSLKSHEDSLSKFHQDSHIYINVNRKNRNIQIFLTIIILLLVGVITFYTLYSMKLL